MGPGSIRVRLPESQIEALRRDEILSVRSLASHGA